MRRPGRRNPALPHIRARLPRRRRPDAGQPRHNRASSESPSWHGTAAVTKAAAARTCCLPRLGLVCNFTGCRCRISRSALCRGAPRQNVAQLRFDAIAAILGVRDAVTYEGQAAVELEQLADSAEHGAYPAAIEAPP